MSVAGFKELPFPKVRRLMEDGGHLGREKHLIHGLYEVDVTEARRAIRAYRVRTGKGLSFMAYIVACVGRAVEQHKSVQACRTWGDRLVVFDDVDVNTMFEVEVKGQKIIRPHIIRAVNKRTPESIQIEIQAFQSGHAASPANRFIDLFVWLPAVIRRAFLRVLFRSPRWIKEMNGTVAMTSVGMFGTGGGWGVPVTNHTLQITLGGIATRPTLIKGKLENRQMLCLTLSVDHDIVDGAPAARFAHALKTLIEGQALLQTSSA